MYKVLWNASVLATGAATSIVFCHTFQGFQRKSVLAESVVESDVTSVEESSLDLELRQVQVFFRHGARTPLHTLEGFKQVSYDVDLVMRPHLLSLFPYERISSHSGLPIDWSPYEHRLRRKDLLSGGAICGQLTSYGQEQMYNLGLRIRDTYGEQLDLSTFNPNQFYVLSTNITRTVESARCVIAGIYGTDQLKDYASEHGPLPILVSETSNNILVPDTNKCTVLRHVNHAAMLHFDFTSDLKTDREVLEKHIDEAHDIQQKDLEEAQEKFSRAFETHNKKSSSSSSSSSTSLNDSVSMVYNTERQPVAYDKQLYESIQNRNDAVDKVHRFWHNVMTHHPTLGKRLPKEELKALLHLRQLEVEEFQTKFTSGFRFKFHFDSNPHFYNKEICKEVTVQPDGSLVSSFVTDIKWKKGRSLKKLDSSKSGDTGPLSLFSWLSVKKLEVFDPISQALKESWRDPLEFYQHVSYKMDHSTTKKINFVFLYDDMKARLTHGWDFPKGLQEFFGNTVDNGTLMMYHAMTGRHERERQVVTSLAVGRLLTDMVNRAEGAMRGVNPQRLCLYSSHDSTMVSLLESLGLWKNVWPPFGADLRLEIYQDKNISTDFYVRVMLLGEPVKLRGQDKELIRWENFRKVVDSYSISQEDFDRICASNFLKEVAKDLLQHEEGEKLEAKKSKTISETPAGM